MLPFSLSFRRLLKKYIPQLSTEDLIRYENLTSLRHQLLHDIQYPPYIIKMKKFIRTDPDYGDIYKEVEIEKNFTSEDEIDDITNEANKIIKPVEKYFDKVKKYDVARKQYIFAQGNLFQIPTSLKGIGRYIQAYKNYNVVQLTTKPSLWINRIKYDVKQKNTELKFVYSFIGIILILILILFFVWLFSAKWDFTLI